jgi:ketosteroid isomerase-like protein
MGSPRQRERREGLADSVDVNRQEMERVEETIDAEVRAIEDDAVDDYFALLTDDALFLPPDTASLGGDELRDWLREFLEQWRVEWLAFHHDETEVCDDLAFHRFSYSWRLEPKMGGELQVAHGKGLHLLRRGEDGSWKIAREIWNARPTPITI